MGFPNWVAVPLAFGIGAGFAYTEEEYPTLFLNSEQILELKKTVGVLENSSDEVIWNAVGRITEGTVLTGLFGSLFGALKFAKNNIPKFSKKKVIKTTSDVAKIAAGSAVIAGAATKAESEEIKEPITDAEIDKAYGAGSVEKEFENNF